MEKEKKPKEELDTETTIVDMNVEGMPGYSKHRKKKGEKVNLPKGEFWKMAKGAFLAYLPAIGIVCAVGIFIYLLAVLWLS